VVVVVVACLHDARAANAGRAADTRRIANGRAHQGVPGARTFLIWKVAVPPRSRVSTTHFLTWQVGAASVAVTPLNASASMVEIRLEANTAVVAAFEIG